LVPGRARSGNSAGNIAVHVPAQITKTRKARIISLTPELEEIIERRRKARVTDCDLIFHRAGEAIVDYRKAWHSACVINGLGASTAVTAGMQPAITTPFLMPRRPAPAAASIGLTRGTQADSSTISGAALRYGSLATPPRRAWQ